MKDLRLLGTAVLLTFVLVLPAFAGETPTPPGSNCDPGQINTPCSSALVQTSGETATPAATAPGQVDTPPSGDLSITEIASSVLLSIVSLF